MWSVRWPDRIDAFVGPGHVVIHAGQRGAPWARKPALHMRIDRSSAEASLGDLLSATPGADALRGASVRVVLSNEHVRYGVLSSDIGLTRREEREMAARVALRETYQGLADTWQVALADTAPGHAIAAGVPPSIVENVVSSFGAAGARVVSIRPLLAHCLNVSRLEPTASTPRWLACLEPGRCVVARIDRGSARIVRSQRAPPGDRAKVLLLIRQTCLQEGLPFEPGAILAYELASRAPAPDAGPDWLLSRIALDAATSLEPVAEPS